MRLILACAIAAIITVGIGGCFGHHEKAVVVEPVYTPPFK
jgi:hypothetical protein